MDELDDAYSLALVSLVLKLSVNITFTHDAVQSHKTYFIRRVRASASSIMCELGSKPRNYCRMSDASFWKLHSTLKDEINKTKAGTSRRSRKKC